MNQHVDVTLMQATDVADQPLVIDLDGTLIRSDLLIETGCAALGADPLCLPALFAAWLKGKAALKADIAARTDIDPATLPYNDDVLAMARAAHAAGRPVYLASASNERFVEAVCHHLGCFDGWMASDARTNLSGPAKAERLVELFGEGGFDYAGNDRADLAVWAHAGKAIAVGASSAVRGKLAAFPVEATILDVPAPGWKIWLKLLRVHQYAKNALVLLPLLASHSFSADSVWAAVMAMVAFSLTASSVYILNDMVDISADRAHLTKRKRPLAAGTVPLMQAMLLIPLLLVAAAIIAILVSPLFFAVLSAYFALTTAYTFVLKRKMLVDVVALSLLYTVRVIGGAAAIHVEISEWLLAFSLFFFTSLALIKRYTELAGRVDASLPDPSNRNYKLDDLGIVATLAAATGCNAITVFALYLSSDTVHRLYHHPQLLWLICPVLMYWVSRALLMAHRRLMHDDPIVFALKDWNSLLAGGMIGAILLLAL